MQSIVFQGY